MLIIIFGGKGNEKSIVADDGNNEILLPLSDNNSLQPLIYNFIIQDSLTEFTIPKITGNITTGSYLSSGKAAEKPEYTQSVDVSEPNESSNTQTDNKKVETIENFIYYCQVDPEYKNIPYGDQTIGSYGCGPTNMAMIVSTIKGKTVTPNEMAALSISKGCFVSGSGTSYAFFTIAANAYGVESDKISATKSNIINELKSGNLIICNMGPGVFTRRGHFLILRGITSDGSVLIADSGSRERTYEEWNLDDLVSQFKMDTMWVFKS